MIHCYKFSLDYFLHLVDFKSSQLTSLSLSTGAQWIFGSEDIIPSKMGGDFQLVSFLEVNGVLGLVVLLLAILLNVNKENWLPVSILFAWDATLRGNVFLSGQFMFGFFLAMGNGDRFVGRQDASSALQRS